MSIGTSPAENSPKPSANDAHSRPHATRTASERVNTPANAQKDNAMRGAAANVTNAIAADTLPAVITEASPHTSSHGAGGAAMPSPNTHDVVAARHS